MTNSVDQFCNALERICELDVAERGELTKQVEQFSQQESLHSLTPAALDRMLGALVAVDARALENESPELVAALAELLWRSCASIEKNRRATGNSAWPSTPDLVPHLTAVYQRLAADSNIRVPLLKCLVAIGNAESLEQFAELIVLDPPSSEEHAALAFAPLFQRTYESTGVLYPRLLDGLSHAQAAAPILDLSNHLARTHAVDRHPAADHVHALAGLLGEVVQRLQRLTEKHPLQDPLQTKEQLQSSAVQVAAGSALVVALCDALGLIGNHDVVGCLYNALDLPHRRIKTEAAAALARLDQPTGDEALRQLAEEPATRFRALAYLEELKKVQIVAEKFRSKSARAEGELALWLAEPTQIGWPPATIKLLDETCQYWPGFDEPQQCYLFHFSYQSPRNEIQGVGIAGPVVHWISCNLSDLPPADIYAMYAGWQAEHAEISERAFSELSLEEQQTVSEQLASTAAEYEAVKPMTVGLFLGELHVVATAERNGQPGVLILDAGQLHWFPRSPSRRPLGPTEIYWLYKGRKLLGAFNRE